MFRTVPLSIVSSFSLHTQQWYMSYRFADCLRAESGWKWFRPDPASSVLILLASCQHIYHCCVYGEKLLMMDRGTAQNM